MILAGVLAERQRFGHHLEDSFLGDIAVWRRALGVADQQTLETISATAEITLEDARDNTDELIHSNRNAMHAVASALFDNPEMTLTYEEVFELVRDNPTIAARP